MNSHFLQTNYEGTVLLSCPEEKNCNIGKYLLSNGWLSMPELGLQDKVLITPSSSSAWFKVSLPPRVGPLARRLAWSLWNVWSPLMPEFTLLARMGFLLAFITLFTFCLPKGVTLESFRNQLRDQSSPDTFSITGFWQESQGYLWLLVKKKTGHFSLENLQTS